MKISELKFDTEKSFRSISIPVVAMQRLARSEKNRALLERHGIDVHNFDPVIATEICMEQWVRILIFYASECKYEPAKNILAGLKKIIIG
jgi:hypothetical protein